jgi:glyoxylase-like metal-dependent hydrolase (beta-lactamase superfamily II)
MKYFRYHSTNCFFVESKNDDNLLAIDAGWPCSLLEYQRGMKRIGLQFKKIKWAVVTHFHLDHAGLISEFQNNGIQCFVFENQYEYIDLMEKTISKNYKNYKLIEKEKLKRITTGESKEYFNNLGIGIEVIIMNGHSKDSVSVVKDNEIIIGDLTPMNQIMDNDIKNRSCWEVIKSKEIKRVYPSHSDILNWEEI